MLSAGTQQVNSFWHQMWDAQVWIELPGEECREGSFFDEVETVPSDLDCSENPVKEVSTVSALRSRRGRGTSTGG
jgi:hypothetical protein